MKQKQWQKIWKKVVIEKKPQLKGIIISDWAKQMWDKVEYPVKKQTINLVQIQVKDLGIKEDYSTFKQICDRAKKLGLELCPPQIGPQLREDYKNQPLGECLYILMKPITDSDGGPHVSLLGRHSHGLWLRGPWAHPDLQWAPGPQLVVVLRKSDTLKLKKLKPLKSSNMTLEKRVRELEKKMEKLLGVIKI